MMVRWMGLALLAGCTGATKSGGHSPVVDEDTASEGAAPSETGSGADTSTDSSGDTATPVLRCPSEMVPVPADAPLFCIDRYEGSLSEDEATMVSVAGVLPHTGGSFDDARALCAQTPVVVDGETVGFKRLATLAEWTDAADGVLGPGGATYPTGEDWPEGQCAVMGADGTQLVDELQPTGTFPDCVSAFGVADQLGNAWEWADPGLDVDVDAFVANQADQGLPLTVDPDGVVTGATEVPARLYLEVPGLFGTVGVDDTGRLAATDVFFQATEPFDYVGYVVDRDAVSTEHTGFVLPVRITRQDGIEETETAPLHVRWDQVGQPLTAKVGCAYYTGTPMGCGLESWFFGHPHDFDGTIGARCAADPVD